MNDSFFSHEMTPETITVSVPGRVERTVKSLALFCPGLWQTDRKTSLWACSIKVDSTAVLLKRPRYEVQSPTVMSWLGALAQLKQLVLFLRRNSGSAIRNVTED